MGFHTPIVDDKKQCRQCNVWKPNDSDHFMTRAATDGLFHECKDCRRENARRYCHATWNEVLRTRRLTDDNYRQKINHRGRLYSYAIRRQFAHWFKFIDELGCTGKELHSWLEFQFDSEMSWKNYSSVWTIDHIIALDRFDMTNPTERRLACSWINIQPCKDNFEKHNHLRLYELMNAVVSARRFLQSRSCDMARYHIVGDLLAWLRDKIEL